MVTIARITGLGNRNEVMATMIEEVRTERARGITVEQVDVLLGEVNEEMQSGKIMFNYLIDNTEFGKEQEKDFPKHSRRDWSDMK